MPCGLRLNHVEIRLPVKERRSLHTGRDNSVCCCRASNLLPSRSTVRRNYSTASRLPLHPVQLQLGSIWCTYRLWSASKTHWRPPPARISLAGHVPVKPQPQSMSPHRALSLGRDDRAPNDRRDLSRSFRTGSQGCQRGTHKGGIVSALNHCTINTRPILKNL